MRLGLYLHAALRSFPYLGSYVLEFINNRTQSVGKTGGDVLRHVLGEDGQSIRIQYECCKCPTLFIDSVPYIIFLRLHHRNMQFSSDSYRLYLIFMATTTDYI